ncbi:hypothetical protein KEM48_012302 [Puccinia striiformis f. sp. tritici PST-130]|nr:hypothetical protein KEM48_012302 [Puccinia striiformis f. sp. tritici PST-130]
MYKSSRPLGDPPGITVTDPVATAPSLSASGARPGRIYYKSSRHLGDPSGLTAAGVTLVEGDTILVPLTTTNIRLSALLSSAIRLT